MGISRSATVVLALLMHDGLSLQLAIDLVESKRPCILPNERFRSDLNELETILIRSRTTYPGNDPGSDSDELLEYDPSPDTIT
jgi:protein-tyrosine phosphatase